MDFHERKSSRRLHYETKIKGWKLRNCTACNGSGYYDGNGDPAPKCSSCKGTGKERYKPE